MANSGWNRIFGSMLDGTLYGRWPHTGIWACLLSQADQHGHIDCVPRMLAAKIGCDMDTLQQCLHDFMLPDPGSRTPTDDGRRLELIEPGVRDWGWKLVNHSKYNEKGRKAEWDAERTASGADAQRKRDQRASRRVPTCPDSSRPFPLSESDALRVEVHAPQKGRKRPRVGTRLLPSWNPTPEQLLEEQGKHPNLDVANQLERFREYWKAASGANAVKRDWMAAFRMWLFKADDWKAERAGVKPSDAPSVTVNGESLKWT